MKTISNLLLLFALLSIFSACTVTKRHFGSGYHVEWKHRFSDKEREESGSAKTPVDASEKLMDTPIIDLEKEHDSTSLASSVIDSEVKSDVPIATDFPIKKSHKQPFLKSVKPLKMIKQLASSKRAAKDPSKSPKSDSRQVDIFTWIALGILGLLLIAVLVLHFMKLLAEAPAIIVLALTAIASLVFSTISIKRVFNSPDDYSGKGITIAVFAVSVLLSLGLIFYAFYLFIQAIMNIW